MPRHRPPHFAAWVLASALLGSVAGLPWIWVLEGPLPTPIFASLAAFAGARALGAFGNTRPLSPFEGAALGAVVSTVFWNPLGSTWLNRCFTLVPEGGTFFARGWEPFIVGVVTLGAVSFATIVHRLGKAANLLSGIGDSDGARALRRIAFWCGGAGLAWTFTNEALLVRFVPFARHACDPDVGVVAIVAYGAAAALLISARRYAPATRRDSALAFGLLILCATQAVLSAVHLRGTAGRAAACGGFVACQCCDRWGFAESGRLF